MTFRPRAAYVAPDPQQIEINGQNWVNEAALQHAFGYVLQHSELDVQLEYQVGQRYQRIDLLVSTDHTQWIVEAKRKLTMETSYTIVGQIRSYREHFPEAKCFALVGEVESEAAIETLKREGIFLIVFTPADFGENMKLVNQTGHVGGAIARTFTDSQQTTRQQTTRQQRVPAFNQQFTSRRIQPNDTEFSVFSVSDGFGPTRRFSAPADTRFSSNAPTPPRPAYHQYVNRESSPLATGISPALAFSIAASCMVTVIVLAVLILALT